jgi:hypothetical protein
MDVVTRIRGFKIPKLFCGVKLKVRWINPRRVKLKVNIQNATGEVTAQTLALISWDTVKRAEVLTALTERITAF